MAKTTTVFFCTECGNETPRWQGQCPACRAWNTLAEEPAPRTQREKTRRSAAPTASGNLTPVRLRDVATTDADRIRTGIAEFDFVLGGGIVPGSLTLVGGEPGIGKSTILLQVAARLQSQQLEALYVSGEESAAQVRMRADRIHDDAAAVAFLAETDIDEILAHGAKLKPSVLFVDSIQTVHTADLDGAPGNVGQVRECAARIQRFAKENGIAVFIVGHVTKDGSVAGPRTLEHIVDTVLYFEGTSTLDHRILRATKNRFGSVDEIGVFRMRSEGLEAVTNPSELFLSERSEASSGSAVAPTLEGSRPLLVEVQALCTKTSYGAPQRVATGFDRQRLALLLAVLEKRAGVPFGQLDVFLNVAGGVRITETAVDLAVAAALLSSALDRDVPADATFVGELGLGGELRSVTQLERRLAEAARMGFTRAFVPERARVRNGPDSLRLIPIANVQALFRELRA